jgi:two-component sensor histidine kinase
MRLIWEERGGPAVVPPRRRGFGPVVFERIGVSLEGNIATDFRPEGFRCTVNIGAENLLRPDLFAPSAVRLGVSARRSYVI